MDTHDESVPPAAPMPGATRRDAIDVARVMALMVVVVGHLLLAVVDRGPTREVRGVNLIELRPTWAWITAIAPMPIFFAAGGWANAMTPFASAVPRLRSLVGLGATVVATWSAGVVIVAVATRTTNDSGIVADGARIATQPLWFLAAYVPFAAAGAWLARIARDRPRAAVGGCLAALVLLDVARFGLGAPDWIGWPGFFFAWVTPWLLGGWWRDRSAVGWSERRTGAGLAVVAGLACYCLVEFAGYGVGLIDAVPGARSNTTPPTVYTALAAIAQTGVFMVAASALDMAGRRWRRFWGRAGEAAVGVYVWHLTALALCVGVVAAGMPVPKRLTPVWWWTRPVWWAAVLAVTAVCVAATDRVRRVIRRRAATHAVGPRPTAVLGVAVTVAAAAFVGLEGPQALSLALISAGLFVAAWRLL